ncbi:MAG: VCBS repeat-containing protein, partial [Bacteroidales bacterium]|nr:VCBS repeat-containing protein [Bacteroidales bacterium]
MKTLFTIFFSLLLLSSITLAQEFESISTDIIQVQMSAIAWGDIDNDGDADLLICGSDASNVSTTKLYQNTGNDNFSEISDLSIPGLSISAAEWGDFNNDGFIDLLIQGYDGASGMVKIYKNNGDKTFSPLFSNFPPLYMGAVSWVDFNNDGFLDFSISGFKDESPWNNVSLIYRNNGDETFSELTGLNLPGTMYGKFKWADYNNDTYPDFIITGFDNTYVTEIYTNNGDETFTESGIELHQGWLGDVEWADYNEDNFIDLVISGTGGAGDERFTILYKNNGDGSFSETSDLLPGVSHSSLEWADFDGDGDLDLFISGTQGDPGSGNYIGAIYNNEDGNLLFKTSVAANYWGEVRACDYNNDNYPDLAISGLDSFESIFSVIYKNTTSVSVGSIQNSNFSMS